MQTSASLSPAPAARRQFTLSAVATRRTLVIIAIIAVLLRVASALYQGNHVDTLPGIYDQVSYDGLARRVLEGHGFSFATDHWPATRGGEPTAHWSFLYTLYLTGVYAVFGMQPVMARLIQAVLAGVLQTLLMWRLGKRMFGPAAGLLAAAFAAVYIYFVYYAGALITETFYITSLLWIFDIALRIEARGSPGRRGSDTGSQAGAKRGWLPGWAIWVELGLAIAVAALLRQLVLLLVPFLFLWLWWRITRPAAQASAEQVRRTRLQRWFGWRTLGGFVLATAIVVLAILPWTIRNYRVFHTFTPLNTNSGYVFYWANHPIYGYSFEGILPADGPSYGDLLPKEVLSLNEAEMDKALLVRGLGFVRDDPVRYVILSLSRAREYFKFWPSSDSGMISNISRVGSFGLFLPLMLYGVVLAAVRAWRSRKERWLDQWRADMLLVLGFIVLYTAIHMLTWTLIRYRLPIDAMLLLLAGYATVDLLQRLGVGVNVALEE